MDDPSNEARLWWQQKRKQYNCGLIVAGIIAFLCYAAVLRVFHRDDRLTDVEITVFTIIFQGLGYLAVMLFAKVFYNLGLLSEKLCNPSHPERFRKIVFNLGFWFSVALPFVALAFLLFILFTVPVID